jgi:hypothetical protein
MNKPRNKKCDGERGKQTHARMENGCKIAHEEELDVIEIKHFKLRATQKAD